MTNYFLAEKQNVIQNDDFQVIVDEIHDSYLDDGELHETVNEISGLLPTVIDNLA